MKNRTIEIMLKIMPVKDVGHFVRLAKIRMYVDRIMTQIWMGQIHAYPDNFENICKKDEDMSDILVKTYGLLMGKLISRLQGGGEIG